MPTFSSEFTLGGVILIIGQIILFFGFVWRRSSAETEQRSRLNSAHEKITTLEAEVESKFNTISTSMTLMREQHHELREHLANNYMKREEIAAMERRVAEGQALIMGRIDKFETRLDVVQATILKAIADARIGSRQ